MLSGRNPALVAKEWASLDRLSNGRALPAFGLGVVDPNEQQAFGIAREQRASWFDEALPLIRRFWTEDAVDHAGEHFHYAGLGIGPKPVQTPPDVWLGGQAPSELRQAWGVSAMDGCRASALPTTLPRADQAWRSPPPRRAVRSTSSISGRSSSMCTATRFHRC